MQNTNINCRIVDVSENKTYVSDERLAGNSIFFSGYIRLGFQVLTEVNSKMTPFLECDGA